MLNLDTHVLIFALAGEVTRRERGLLGKHDWSISCIVLWEITKLAQLGRIGVSLDSPDLRAALEDVRVWPLDDDVCRRILDLDFRSDTADEIIAATSLVHGVPLLTRDRRLKGSRIVPLA